MDLDNKQSKTEEDRICVVSQSILRLLSEFRKLLAPDNWVDVGKGYNRLASLCDELHQIIHQARPCGHAEHLEDELRANGEIDRLREVINAAILDWCKHRR